MCIYNLGIILDLCLADTVGNRTSNLWLHSQILKLLSYPAVKVVVMVFARKTDIDLGITPNLYSNLPEAWKKPIKITLYFKKEKNLSDLCMLQQDGSVSSIGLVWSMVFKDTIQEHKLL